MKSIYKKNFGLIVTVTVLGLFTLCASISIEARAKNKINEVLSSLDFSDNPALFDVKLKYDDISCFFSNCNILNTKLTKGNMDLASADIYINVNPFNVNEISVDLKNLNISDFIKNSFFYSYTDDVYKKISHDLYTNIFPMNVTIKTDIEVRDNKEENAKEAEGAYSFGISNNIANINLHSEVYLLNKVYTDTIETGRVKNGEEEDVAELILENVPFKMITKNFKINIEDKNIMNFLYTVYSLLANNEKADNRLLAMNSFFLGIEKNEVVDYKTFEDHFFIMLKEYHTNIDPEEVAYINIIKNIESLLTKKCFYCLYTKTNSISIEGVNKRNISNAGLEALMAIDGLNTSTNYLDNSFNFKFSE